MVERFSLYVGVFKKVGMTEKANHLADLDKGMTALAFCHGLL